MDFLGYETFYVNGSSHSQGGGLEGPEIREESVFPLYQKKWGVKEWGKRSELNLICEYLPPLHFYNSQISHTSLHTFCMWDMILLKGVHNV